MKKCMKPSFLPMVKSRIKKKLAHHALTVFTVYYFLNNKYFLLFFFFYDEIDPVKQFLKTQRG